MDKKDEKLLELLQINSREQLKTLSQKIGLSIDSTKKRIEKLKREGIITQFSIFIDPQALGYELIVNVQIKLHNFNQDDLNRMIAYLKTHSQVIELISISGDYDLTCVIIAKNTKDLDDTSREIRERFKQFIADWKSVINLKIHKFEEYSFKDKPHN